MRYFFTSLVKRFLNVEFFKGHHRAECDHADSIFHLSFLRYAPLIIRDDAAILSIFFLPLFLFSLPFLLFPGNYRVPVPTQDFLSLETELVR